MDYSAAVDYIRQYDDYLIITHANPDGDTLGSASALCSALRRSGKKAYLFNNPEIPDKYLEYVGKYLATEEYKWDKVISVDVASEELFPKGFSGSADLALDHHPGNSIRTENKLLRPRYSSCGEIAYRVILKLCDDITDEEALLLYIAISTDTGCFQYSNTNYNTLETVSKLLKQGIDNVSVNTRFFRKVSKARLQLEGLIYSSLKYYREDLICAALITREMLEKCGATADDLDDIASLACRSDNSKICITIREREDGRSKVSLRTFGGINAIDICSVFGGGGHQAAAGCTIAANPETACEMLISVIDEVLR